MDALPVASPPFFQASSVWPPWMRLHVPPILVRYASVPNSGSPRLFGTLQSQRMEHFPRFSGALALIPDLAIAAVIGQRIRRRQIIYGMLAMGLARLARRWAPRSQSAYILLAGLRPLARFSRFITVWSCVSQVRPIVPAAQPQVFDRTSWRRGVWPMLVAFGMVAPHRHGAS